MNTLKAITEARGITPVELSKMSGVCLTRVRDLIRDGTIGTAQKSTQLKIAKALGLTVKELVGGGDKVKNKVIQTEIARATEHLARLLRNYSDKELYLHITLFTKDKDCAETENDIPDYYSYRLANLVPEDSDGDIAETICKQDGLIHYTNVDGEEFIRSVVPYKGGINNE